MSAVAVIVPAYNAASTIEACLSALVCSDANAPSVLVVDDGSTDETAAIARRCGAAVLTRQGPAGPAAARNAGVAATTAGLIVFVDADVVAPRDAVDRLVAAFDADARLAAAFGSYDNRPAARDTVSLFKNLLHHFVHQEANERSASFWAGFGAIRREAFESVGGFAADRYPRPSIEDIELGARLWRAGRGVRVVRDAQVTHLKRWSFTQLVATDVRQRAYPWSELLLNGEAPGGDLNLRTHDRVAAIAAWTCFLALGAAASGAWPAAGMVAATALAVILLLNRRLYAFFVRTEGWRFGVASVALHVLYYLYSSATFGVCVVRRLFRRRTAVPPGSRAATPPSEYTRRLS